MNFVFASRVWRKIHNIILYKWKWIYFIASIIICVIPALFIVKFKQNWQIHQSNLFTSHENIFNIENFDENLPDPALSFPKLNVNPALPPPDSDKAYYGKITAQDDYDEMTFLSPNINRIFKCPVSKCFKKADDFNENYSKWRIQPPACKSDVNMVILIKSSILRNSLRWHIRKSWAKEIVHEK